LLSSIGCNAELRSSSPRNSLPSSLALVVLLVLNPARVNAQENVGDGSTVIYRADYFLEYAPVNALDMINRIPGTDISSGSSSGGNSSGGSFRNVSQGGRGLGSGSADTQVLINGKRTAGKNNNSEAVLTRIDAGQVDYIELIRGTSGHHDVRGSTQIVNVVLYQELTNSTLNYEVSTDYYQDGKSEPGGSLAYGGQIGRLDILLNASAEPQYNNRTLIENSILPDTSPNDYIHESRIRDQTTYTLSTNLDYAINDNSSARFNALVAKDDDPTSVDRVTVDPGNNRFVPSWEREDIPGTRSNWELGGDYDYRLTNGDRFKILFIANENDTSNTRERWNVFSDGSERKNLFLDSSSVINERIIRGSFTKNIFNEQSIEFGAVRAKTTLDSNLLLGLASLTGVPSAAHGGLTAVNVPNANTTVEEVRYEPFAIHNWPINPRMSIETSAIYEFSEITQSGDFNQSRDFSFFKPKIDYRFDITPKLQLRFMIERFVRQLSFTDFVAASDSEDRF